MITASALPRLMNCPSSAVMPHAEVANPWSALGNDEHEILSDLTSLPPELKKHVPPGARSEVMLSFNVATGEGKIIGEGSGRRYGDRDALTITGTADVIAVDGDTLICIDWKTGHLEVEPAETNPQLAFYALAACRALGLEQAIVKIIYTKIGRVDEARMGTLDLIDFADSLSRLLVKVQKLDADRKHGEIVPTREGSWCRHCPARAFCPTKNALLIQLSGKGLAVVGDTTMTMDKATDAVRQFLHAEQIVKDAKSRLIAFVDENGPIDMGNGEFYGRYQKQGDERLDGAVAVKAIAEVVGDQAKEFASVAIERKVSKAAIERAAKAIGKPPKFAKAVIQKIRDMGGASHASPERPVGRFTDRQLAAPPPNEIEEINRLLRSA